DRSMPTKLAELQHIRDGTRPPPPIAALIGFTLSTVAPGEAVIELAAGRQHAHPMGTLHGGVLCDITDAAMGIAYASTRAEDEAFAALELKINFLKPVWAAKLRAVARLVKRGKTLGSSSVTSPTSNRVSWPERRQPA